MPATSGRSAQGASRRAVPARARGRSRWTIRVASDSRRRYSAPRATAKKTARPIAISRLRTRAGRSSSRTLMSLARTAPHSGQLPTQLIWSVTQPIAREARGRPSATA